jgi:multimeric flavodoxin WrbA
VYGGLQAIMGATPLLERARVNLADYDVVIVGTPVWAGRTAPPVRSFLARLPLEGRQVAYFSTFQGSAGQSFAEMVEMGKVPSLGEMGFKMTRKSTHESINAARQWAKELLG